MFNDTSTQKYNRLLGVKQMYLYEMYNDKYHHKFTNSF